jgi:hypothetical protein
MSLESQIKNVPIVKKLTSLCAFKKPSSKDVPASRV